MQRLVLAIAIFLSATLGSRGVAAQPGESLLIVTSGNEREVARLSKQFGAQRYEVTQLDKSVLALAAKVSEEIDRGQIYEEGERSPVQLRKFSDAVLAAVPKILDYKKIHVVSPEFLPVELIHKDGKFVGDRVAVSHEYIVPRLPLPRVPQQRELPLSSYVIEAVIKMPDNLLRANQDIVQVALSLEKELPLEVHFDSGLRGIQRVLARDDVSILHIDTHGGSRGAAIQVSRKGGMMSASDIPAGVKVPVVLLFGCEGVANAQAFGSVMRERGSEAVISSFAKFESFGITGDATRERRVYDAFFDALRKREDIGTALLRFRAVGKEEMAKEPRRTLTRLFFVLIGNGELRLRWPSTTK